MQMLNLPHLASRVFGAPLMIARAKLDVILAVLAPRFAGGALQPIDSTTAPAAQTSITTDGIAIVPIVGALVSRSGYLDASSGLLSYADIGEVIAEAITDPSVRGVILDIDSSGGEVGGLFDLVDRINALQTASAKPLWAVANECALSAAYAIASTAERIYVTRTAEVGSIGVVAVHIDESAADAKAGLAWNFVFAGERKIDANAHAPLSNEARVTIQADVDRLYGEFCALVAANRRMSVEAVRETQAAIYRGELAVRAGLADRVGTLDAAIAEMATKIAGTSSPARIAFNPTAIRSQSMATNEIEQREVEACDQQTQISQASQPAAAVNAEALGLPRQGTKPTPSLAPAAESQPAMAERLRAEYAEIVAVAAQAARLNVVIDAADAMRRGISADALRRSALDELAARAEATSVVATASSSPVTAESPIVRRAKERAAATRG